MPYRNRNELPESVRNVLPEKAQDIYKEAFNSAWEEYARPEDRREGKSREEAAHAVAWSAVKQKYEKGGDGNWHRKS
ncbi:MULTISPECIES: putative cation transport regulator ChaB [Microbulbifer]|uniref:putative cation transport regulator ChaB n=1 Tax=Microbulbifer TaxID=48073 RepID=UPI001E2FBFF0|nr:MULTISPECIES: putative cation transport regulator ChaB [Microbulbifer]UHQ54886.1 putative cation transport regulator ChaB [Microbulbifer sp. YPW16]